MGSGIVRARSLVVSRWLVVLERSLRLIVAGLGWYFSFAVRLVGGDGIGRACLELSSRFRRTISFGLGG